MNKAAKPLYSYFQPEKYELDTKNSQVKIFGRKIGPPSKRITLHQNGLKITGAQIIRMDKRGDQEFTAARINHLPTFEQVRLHSQETLFPGTYEITINFVAKPNQQTESPKRNLFPCIDEPEAWTNADLLTLR